LWMSNLGTERDWCFVGEPLPSLGSRSLSYDMGNVVGGSSGINASVWARGHRVDWEDFREATRDEGWGYESVLELYRKVEHWAGPPNPRYRGTAGPVYVAPSLDRAVKTSSDLNRLGPGVS
jgi:choline dehydrogenase